MTAIFGKEVQVKLDMWHALTRVTGEIKKKDMADRKKRMMFNQELRMCFRRHSDISPKERKYPTSSPQVITKKLEELKQRWEKKIPAKATKAITNLMEHTRIGCLRYSKFFTIVSKP